MRTFELGELLDCTFNTHHEHTIAQPVCEGTLREHLSKAYPGPKQMRNMLCVLPPYKRLLQSFFLRWGVNFL